MLRTTTAGADVAPKRENCRPPQTVAHIMIIFRTPKRSAMREIIGAPIVDAAIMIES
jgi:hypothetical protein